MTERLSDERLRYLRENQDDVEYDDVSPMTDELIDLRVENAHLRERCTWLQERRAVLRKLLSAKWSKRKEVRRMRAKLAAGPVMPETPSEAVLAVLSTDSVQRFGSVRVYGAIRDTLALAAEQNDPR